VANRRLFGPGTVYDHDKELAGRHDLGTETIVSVSGARRTSVTSPQARSRTIPASSTIPAPEAGCPLNLGKDLGDLVTLNFYSNLIPLQREEGITNNDNTNTSNWIVLSGTPATST